MLPSYDNIAVTPQESTLQQPKTRSPRSDIAPHLTGALRSDFAQSHPAKRVSRGPTTTQEDLVLRHFKNEWSRCTSEEPTWDGYRQDRPVLIADLHDFEICVSPDGDKARRYELIGLHHLEVPRAKKLAFEGVLRVGSEAHYVESITIQDYSIEGFGDAENPVVVVYLQSTAASKDSTHDIWYRLNKPAPKYERYHEPFLWVAQLAKHVLDFMDEQPAASVGLESFRHDFQQWLTTRFCQNTEFKHWLHAIHDHEDFRVPVNAYIEFLYQQAWNLPNSKALLTHTVWADCMVAGLTQIKKQDQKVTFTLATPDVHGCFKKMYFKEHIRTKHPSEAVRIRQRYRKAQLGFQTARDPRPVSTPLSRPYDGSFFQVGDVVAFDPRQSDKQNWRNADWEWLLHVHDIRMLRNGVQRLFGIYLYRPRETDIFTARYPYQNEFFFSDNCNCNDGELLSTDINGQYDIEWTPSVIPTQAFFVRQTYLTLDSSFVTYAEKHRICDCKKDEITAFDRYHRGDTVYVTKTLGGRKILEPVIIHQKDRAAGHFVVRRLARLLRDFPEQAKHAQRTGKVFRNELVLTDDYEEMKVARIERRCHIRFIPKRETLQNPVPFPYNRGGAGDFWFFSMGLSVKDDAPRLIYLARPPNNFNECQDIVAPPGANKLLGMSLFSGGGNLDRGIEEGGAIDFHTAVELDDAAIHTQRANTRDPTKKMFWYGSVDDHLNAALEGGENPLIADIGDVNIIIAGSPCPGFSSLQQNIRSAKSEKNASHITTICSYVDLYRPEYAVLENVVSMAATRTELEGQNVLSHVIACFVSMGYQVNQFIMDAWNYGSCQQRSRIILTIAAPGLELIAQPKHTHSMLATDTIGRSLGFLPNGQRFGQREHYPTPFPHVTPSEVFSDLPNIGNANVLTCVSHPSHRVSQQPSGTIRALLQCIPQRPPGSGYKEAYDLGLIPTALQKPTKETGKAFKRIKESGLVPTITTILCIQDSRNGASLHWSQDRPITILEARRTQGYLDNEPIIGNLTAQYRIVGNGVDRKVAFALGLAIRQAVGGRQSLLSREVTEPKQGVIYDLEDDVEHFSDATSVLSSVQVDVLPPNGTILQSSTPARSSRYLERRASSASADFPGIPGFEGTSDPRDIEPDAPPSMDTPTTGFLSRLSSTITSGLTALTHRARPTPATQETIPQALEKITPHSTKRSRNAPTPYDDTEEVAPKKRVRQAVELPTPVAVPNAITPKRKTTTVEASPKKRRVTRHSGLEATFAPKQWNKRPEKEYAAKE
jgi:DNA (cytosine-5)-methyltransferase 1